MKLLLLPFELVLYFCSLPCPPCGGYGGMVLSISTDSISGTVHGVCCSVSPHGYLHALLEARIISILIIY